MTSEPRLELTPSQTVGPFFHYALPYSGGERLVPPSDPDAVRIVGSVVDGASEPVSDAMVEIWQADAEGRYAHPADGRNAAFHGFGRVGTDETGSFRIETIKPGRVPGAKGGQQAPHLNVIVFARGMLSHTYTRIYFSDEASANGEDAVLDTVEPDRRRTLIATREETPGGPVYRFEVHLQGENETVFFDA